MSSLSSYAQFQVNGSASNLGGGTYEMTTATNNIYGSIWYKLQHDLTTPINIQGQLYFGIDDVGADGIAFVLQNNCLAAGTAGGGIGYEALPGQSIAVEFDTYQNILGTGSFDNSDPLEDHIAVMANGITNHANPSGNLFGPVILSNIEDGAWHDFQISYNPTSKLFTVSFDGITRVSMTYDIVANIFAGNPFVYWGFTSSTGGFNNQQQVKINANLSTLTLPNETICTGSVTVDLPPLTRYNGLNQALNKPAYASSSQWDVITNPREALDGNMGSRWASTTAPASDNEWFYLDLGTSYDIDSVVIEWEGAFGSGYQILTSNDAVTWTPQATVVGGDGGKDKIIFSATGRYVRWQGITRATGWGYSFWEFRVYGKANYVWSPNNGTIDDIYSATATFTPAVTTTYTVTIPDPCKGAVTYDMTITVDCPMPLELLSFTGTHSSGVNHLNWTTNWESNTSHFTVWRSNDGVNYSPIGRVMAAGNSQTLKSYGFVDPQPYAIGYYKLISTDLDGSSSTSSIVTIATSNDASIYITNPIFSNTTTLVLPGYSDWVSLSVVDVQGRVLLEDYVTSTEGTITFGNTLPSGASFYLVIVQTATERKVFKVVKN